MVSNCISPPLGRKCGGFPHRYCVLMPGATATGYGTGRERLLAAARQLLIESGGDLDVEAVAATAGVSKSLIWRPFGNRAGLLTAVIKDFWDGYDDALADARLSSDASWAERERER